MKKVITVAIVAIIMGSCKKETKKLIEPIVYENLYDTNGTGKKFIDLYITNTDGQTKAFINNTMFINTNGSTVKAFNAYVGDTIKVECTQSSIQYMKVYIRKSYTVVIDTTQVATQLFTKYIIR